MTIALRRCDAVTDRDAAHTVLRAAFARGDAGYTIHPGEWDWWCFHRDPAAAEPTRLIGERVLVNLEPRNGELSVFGATPSELVDIVERLDEPITTIGWVSTGDRARADAVAALGFAPTGDPGPVFERAPAGGMSPSAAPPDGFTIRSLAGEHEAATRSTAARRSFRTDMPPDRHVERYRTFMRTPAYDASRDVVAVDPDGRVAAFAIHWIDEELSLAQLEPVGTDPDFVRRGLARAVIDTTLERIAAAGVARVRVITDAHRTAAVALYRSCGFDTVDRLQWWQREKREKMAP